MGSKVRLGCAKSGEFADSAICIEAYTPKPYFRSVTLMTLSHERSLGMVHGLRVTRDSLFGDGRPLLWQRKGGKLVLFASPTAQLRDTDLLNSVCSTQILGQNKACSSCPW